MRAGRKNKKILIEVPTVTLDKYGDKEIDWNQHSFVWAAISPLRGNAFFSAVQDNIVNITKFTISYDDAIKPDFRITYKNVVYEIVYLVNIEERNVDLEIMASVIT